MKKALLAACLLALTLWSLPARAAGQPHVLDISGLLTGQEQDRLEQRAQAIEDAYGCGLYIATVDNYLDYASHPVGAACAIYRNNDLGAGEDKDGLILMLSMDDRDYATAPYGPLAHQVFSDRVLQLQEEEFLDDFRDNDWYAGFSDFLDTSERCLAAVGSGESITAETLRPPKVVTPEVVGKVFGQDFLGALVIALIVCLAFRAGMKSVKEKRTAAEYMRTDESCLTLREDRFTHATQTRHTIQTSRSSGGHSGGSSHHSGGFSGRSGKF